MLVMNGYKLIITLLLVFSAFVIYQSNYQDSNIKAGILISEEKVFLEPVDIVWSGEIISTMVSGSCVGLKGEFDNYSWAMACVGDSHSTELWQFEGTVTITGKWLGITCGYKNTIFGECVPDVRIENITATD